MEEITLFDPDGNPVAYIAPDDKNTIYLWSGKPVAYLKGEDIYMDLMENILGGSKKELSGTMTGIGSVLLKGHYLFSQGLNHSKHSNNLSLLRLLKSLHRLSHLSQRAFPKPHSPYFLAGVKNEPNGR